VGLWLLCNPPPVGSLAAGPGHSTLSILSLHPTNTPTPTPSSSPPPSPSPCRSYLFLGGWLSTALLGFMGLRLASSLLGGRGAAWGLELYGGLLVFAGWVGANKWSGRGMSRRCL
jgi:hypothetical protein